MGRDPGIAARLLAWYERGHRDLPWRETRDGYRIWISEIMLQQTRAQAAVPYYLRFLERFPTVEALAAARETEVLEAWSGLGYYSRARNLHRAARQIAAAGAFPREFQAIGNLPGVGPYTAAAIASIAFNLPHAVLDGNVLRVVSRVLNDASDIYSGATRERFRAVAQQWLDPGRPGLFNQAVMELGATVCLPRAPVCGACPLEACCQAHRRGVAAQLPVKRRQTAPERIEAELALVSRKGRILLCRSRIAGFWDLPAPDSVPGFRRLAELGGFRHAIMHRRYRFTVVSGAARATPPEMCWAAPAGPGTVPLSTIARKALLVAAL